VRQEGGRPAEPLPLPLLLLLRVHDLLVRCPLCTQTGVPRRNVMQGTLVAFNCSAWPD
jgi:hypothetical protein